MKVLNHYRKHRGVWTGGAALAWIGITVGFHLMRRGFQWPIRVIWLVAGLIIVWEMARFFIKWRPARRKLVFAGVMTLFFALMLEGVCWLFLKVMAQRDERLAPRGALTMDPDAKDAVTATLAGQSRYQFSATIGWVQAHGQTSDGINTNSHGMRGTHEYPAAPADPAKRILCLGDSFTFGVAVRDEESYPAAAEASRPGTEWLNFGNPGCCLTQMYLRYHGQAKSFGGKHVVIGFMTNDAQRTVNCFRPFLNSGTGFPMTKPFAKFSGTGLSIEPNPYLSATDYQALLNHPEKELARLRSLDYLSWSRQTMASDPIIRTGTYVIESLQIDRNLESITRGSIPFRRLFQEMLPADPYGDAIWQPESHGFQAITALFDRFYGEVREAGAQPLIVIIPGPLDVKNYQRGKAPQYEHLLAHFQKQNLRYLDFLDPLTTKYAADLSPEALFVRLHYQPHVNQLLADEIIKSLGLP